MPLRRIPLLPSGLRAESPSCASIGASSAAGAAGGGTGMVLAGGRRSATLQIAFCQLPHFSAGFYRSAASPIEEDWRLLPPLIARAVLPVTVSAGFAGCLRVCA